MHENSAEAQGVRPDHAKKTDVALELAALPDDIDRLKRLAVDLSIVNDDLLEQLRLARAELYGRSSEKLRHKDESQLLLFAPEPAPVNVPDHSDERPVGAHSRKRPVRRGLPADLPRVDRIHDIPEEDKICACGAHKRTFSSETSEQLESIPEVLQVVRHIRPKYSCPVCEGTAEPDKPTFAIAPPPLQLIAKSIASPGLLARIVTAKFVDSTPLYRQQAQFARMGVQLSRGTMCSWVIKVGEACGRLVELLFESALSGNVIHLDETPLQVLKEEGRDASDMSYAWVVVGGTPKQPVIGFTYDPSRSGQVAQAILKGYNGHVVTDAYVGYAFLDYATEVVRHGCWAHSRRGFTDVIKAAGERIGASNSLAQQAVRWIRKLYQVERQADDNNLSEKDRGRLRELESKPVLESLRAWLVAIQPEVVPKSLLGKAIAYTLKEWDHLAAYADTGFVPIDNNRAENAIRPFVVGRKNWLFADTPAGAMASMRLYSLVETAKANGVDPYWYLRFLFERLPLARTDDALRALLPMHADKSLMRPYAPPARKRKASRAIAA